MILAFFCFLCNILDGWVNDKRDDGGNSTIGVSSCHLSTEYILLHLLALKHSKIKDVVHIDFKWLIHSRTRWWNNVFFWGKLLWSDLVFFFFPWKFLIQALFYCHVSFNDCLCMLPNVCPAPGGLLFDWASSWCSPSWYWHCSIECDPIVLSLNIRDPFDLWTNLCSLTVSLVACLFFMVY